MSETARRAQKTRPSAATGTDTPWRSQLSERRRRLVARPELRGRQDVRMLLAEVDAALKRLDDGVFGTCEACHGSIETDRLLADPLTRVCLECLSRDQATALERDLELASSIQSHLLPPAGLRAAGWEIAHRYRPLGPVSGDYCDVLEPEAAGPPLHFFLGDVAGKGVAASLLMSSLHAIFRSLVSTGLPLDTLVERANRLFCDSTLSNSYATLVAGRLLPSGRLEIVNAGHPAPLLTGEARSLDVPATGLPLGLFCDTTYRSVHRDLRPGDLLLLYTDGVSEARNGGPETYGPARLPSLIEAVRGLDPEAVLEALAEDLRAFGGGLPLEDDVAVMAIRRSEGRP
jgi:sigma-B regulation protein RsbU (phosphoserine phosphatase)